MRVLAAASEAVVYGTIYPDVIESAGADMGNAHMIKSHQNVGGLPDDMAMQLVEPLRELFKNKVRKTGLELGLPYDMVYRHPFPGPGLGVRILGEVKKEYAELRRQADAVFLEELHRDDYYHETCGVPACYKPWTSLSLHFASCLCRNRRPASGRCCRGVADTGQQLAVQPGGDRLPDRLTR